jgi:hypothetical protein
MNLIYKKPLIVAIAAAIGSLVPLTGAEAIAIKPDPATGLYTGAGFEPAKLPLEAKEATTSYSAVYPIASASLLGPNSGDLEAYIYTVPNYPVSASKNLSVKVTLTNGAKFLVTPKLICPSTGVTDSYGGKGISGADWGKVVDASTVSGANAAGATAYKLLPLSTGNMGILTFEFPQGFTIPNVGSGACLLSYSAALAAESSVTAAAVLKGGAAGQNIDMAVEITYQDVFASVTKTATIPLIKFVTAYQATISKDNLATKTASDVTVDVRTDSKKFVLKDGSVTNIVLGGSVNVSATVAGIRNATGALVSASDLFTTATITIDGSPVSTLGSITFSSANMAGACGGTPLTIPVGTPTVTSGGGGSITVSLPMAGDAYSAMVSGVTGLAFCLNADGTKVMSDGQISIIVNGISPGGALFEIGSGNIALVGRNGTVVRVLNIPNSTGTDRAFIRFYNTSTQPVVVTGTLYGQDGKEIGNKGAKLFDPLQSNDTKTLDSAALMAKVGATAAWTGRAWLMIQAPISADMFKVQALVRTANGTLTNVSSDATD